MTVFSYLMLASTVGLIIFVCSGRGRTEKDYAWAALIWIVSLVSGSALALNHLQLL